MSELGHNIMRRILLFSAIVEVGTGLALMIIPGVVLTMLVGGDVSDAWLPLGRCFGVGILALGVACWPERALTNRGETIVFAPTRLMPDRIPDQPGAGSHGFATERVSDDAPTGRTLSYASKKANWFALITSG